jgi:hypothetical protein
MRRREQKPPKRELGQVGSSTSRKPHSDATGIRKSRLESAPGQLT